MFAGGWGECSVGTFQRNCRSWNCRTVWSDYNAGMSFGESYCCFQAGGVFEFYVVGSGVAFCQIWNSSGPLNKFKGIVGFKLYGESVGYFLGYFKTGWNKNCSAALCSFYANCVGSGVIIFNGLCDFFFDFITFKKIATRGKCYTKERPPPV